MKYKEIKKGIKVKVIENNNKVWIGEIIKMKKGSRTKVLIKDIERGPGWDAKRDEYVGLYCYDKNGNFLSWNRGENFGYGQISTVHINQLEKI